MRWQNSTNTGEPAEVKPAIKRKFEYKLEQPGSADDLTSLLAKETAAK